MSAFDLFTIIMHAVDSDNLQSLLAHVILGGEMLNNIPSLPGTSVCAHECNIVTRNYADQGKHYGRGQRNRFTFKSDNWVLGKKSPTFSHHDLPVLNGEH